MMGNIIQQDCTKEFNTIKIDNEGKEVKENSPIHTEMIKKINTMSPGIPELYSFRQKTIPVNYREDIIKEKINIYSRKRNS